jgi:hypothetical protein
MARDRPDILERMKAGEFTSVREAAREAGIIKDVSLVNQDSTAVGEDHPRGTASDPSTADHRHRLTTREKGKDHEPVWPRLTGFCVPGRLLPSTPHPLAMHLSVPVGSAPAIGRMRPYKIGGPADVGTAQRMYPSITPHHGKTEGRSWVLITVSATCDPSALQGGTRCGV